jgi:predicted nucleic acid-binding protein
LCKLEGQHGKLVRRNDQPQPDDRSRITVAEVVTGPLKAKREALVERYRRTITQNPGWNLREFAVLAARLRLQHALKLPDAFQLAVALEEGCSALVTHDRDFGAVSDIVVLGTAPRRRT